jgi:hypothetical protein
MRRTVTQIVFAAMVAVVAAPAMAQDGRRAEVGLGYSLVGIIEEDAPSLPAGWLGSVAVGMTDRVSAVGEVAGNYTSEDGELLTLHTYQGGVRFGARRSPKVRPYGQLLLGGVTVSAEGEYFNRFVMEPGGGVDLPIGRGKAVRLGAGFPIIFSGGETINLFRIHAGLVF